MFLIEYLTKSAILNLTWARRETDGAASTLRAIRPQRTLKEGNGAAMAGGLTC